MSDDHSLTTNKTQQKENKQQERKFSLIKTSTKQPKNNLVVISCKLGLLLLLIPYENKIYSDQRQGVSIIVSFHITNITHSYTNGGNNKNNW